MTKFSPAMVRAIVILYFSEIEAIDGHWCALDDPDTTVSGRTLTALHHRGLCTPPLSYGGRGGMIVKSTPALQKQFGDAIRKWEAQTGKDAWATFVERNGSSLDFYFEVNRLLALLK